MAARDWFRSAAAENYRYSLSVRFFAHSRERMLNIHRTRNTCRRTRRINAHLCPRSRPVRIPMMPSTCTKQHSYNLCLSKQFNLCLSKKFKKSS
ncbi:MAG: hypothetical protein ACI8W7_004945 [Gammaproteobacteria bacterium]|jgi:hypothetical protein